MELDFVIRSQDGTAWAERLAADGTIAVGRHATCQLRLEGDHVSRTHLVIDAGEVAMRVEDRSSNGTLAGEVLLRRQAMDVPYGTVVQVGNYTLQVTPAVPGSPVPRADQPPPPMTTDPMAMTGGHALSGAPGGHSIEDHATKMGGVDGAYPPTSLTLDTGSSVATGATPGSFLPSPTGTFDSAMSFESFGDTAALEQEVALRREIHAKLLENLDLAKLDAKKLDDPSMRPRVLTALRRLIDQMESRLRPDVDRSALVGELADEALGLGPLERFIADPTVSEIMVVDPMNIYVEQNGRLIKTSARFTDDERVRSVIERIVTPLGRRIDESSPLVDARLADGSRVNAIIKPLALRGSCITIRKFAKTPLDVQKLISFGALNARMARLLERAVLVRKNIIISGGTGSGKTTLLNVLSGAIPSDERIVTIEDAAELQLKQPHVVSLESRPPNMEGKGEYTIRDLVRNSLRMRPDRIVIGECRGGEALDMLQAMNTGHDGSLTTTHANSPTEAVGRIETLALMSALDLPARAIREQIASSINLIVQQARLSDGSRKISEIAEVTGMDEDEGRVQIQPIFQFVRTGTGPGGEVLGEHRATGYLPTFLGDFLVAGLVSRGEPYV